MLKYNETSELFTRNYSFFLFPFVTFAVELGQLAITYNANAITRNSVILLMVGMEFNAFLPALWVL